MAGHAHTNESSNSSDHSAMDSKPPLANSGSFFKFISLGDWGNPISSQSKSGNVVLVDDSRTALHGTAGTAKPKLEPVTHVIARKMRQLAAEDPSIRFVIAAGDNFYENGVVGPPPAEHRSLLSIDGTRPKKLEVSLAGIRGRMEQDMECQVRLSAIASSLMKWNPNNHRKVDPLWNDVYFGVHRNRGVGDTKPNPPNQTELPWLVCLGNHDYRGDASEQIQFSYEDRAGLWFMPSPYYCVTYRHGATVLHVVMIDTCLLCRKDLGRKYHKEWIRDTLRDIRASDPKDKKSSVVVVGHYPLVSNGVHCSRNLNRENMNSEAQAAPGRKPTIKAWLINTLLEYKVDLYISGHNHLLEHMVLYDKTRGRIKPLECIVSGSGSKLTTRQCSASPMWSWIPRWPLRSGSGRRGGSSNNVAVSENDGNFEGGAYLVHHSLARTNPGFGMGYGFVLHSLQTNGSFRHTFYYLKPLRAGSSKHTWATLDLASPVSGL